MNVTEFIIKISKPNIKKEKRRNDYGKCNDHQREIALTLWGVYTGKPMTISQLAKTKGVSYNAIRQIEKRFLQHILTNKNRDTLIKLK